ncbi:3-demethylubiquinone-9 3-methyltransferase [Methyloligella halotolerans]|uniref:3-demethylubiquinone-9 3-methyltransferase n=1 Tax=Methyloligella halotolerans TaxID=1177755 RepID=A0A1E2RUV0_9HYPH|nr:VOC family protein [Methyloligella halotolerans]ODA65993.1 3-demethylubiquinone-9 3-methyltransferase [Methyloligella halotolerans]
MHLSHPLTPCLWFDTKAEDAARFYCSVFPHSRITQVTHFPDAGQEVHGKPAGSVLMVVFELGGQRFSALNGGPQFTFDEAVSFQVLCESQDEIDHYWTALTADGGEEGPCGWLKDKFGLSWQIAPAEIGEMLSADPESSARVMSAMLKMGKIDLGALQNAFRQAG